jgi:hypothetical protein
MCPASSPALCLQCAGHDMLWECGDRKACAGDCLPARDPGEACRRGCPQLFQPVCDASSGIAHSNACLAQCEGVKEAQPCENPETCKQECWLARCGCDDSDAPVCGMGGRLYGKACKAKVGSGRKRGAAAPLLHCMLLLCKTPGSCQLPAVKTEACVRCAPPPPGCSALSRLFALTAQTRMEPAQQTAWKRRCRRMPGATAWRPLPQRVASAAKCMPMHAWPR